MTVPIFLHSGMMGAPVLTNTVRNHIPIFTACLVNGFNTQPVISATAASGVVAFNFGGASGFAAKEAVAIEGASNASVNGTFRVQSAANNQVFVEIPGVPDGAVGGTITLKYAPLGWTRPYTGTGIAAYRQGGTASHKRFLRVYDNTSQADRRYYVRGYENMTGVSTGTGPFPNTGEVAGQGADILSRVDYPGDSPWMIVGTPRAFWFMSTHQSDFSGVPLGTWNTYLKNDASMLFFGELDRIQQIGDTYAYGVSATYNFPPGGIYGSRAHNLAADSRPPWYMQSPSHPTQNYISGGYATYPDPGSGNMMVLDAPFISEAYNGAYCVRGYMPGILTTPNNMLNSGIVPGHIFENTLGVTGRLLHMSGWGSDGTSSVLVKLDEDWGDV